VSHLKFSLCVFNGRVFNMFEDRESLSREDIKVLDTLQAFFDRIHPIVS